MAFLVLVALFQRLLGTVHYLLGLPLGFLIELLNLSIFKRILIHSVHVEDGIVIALEEVLDALDLDFELFDNIYHVAECLDHKLPHLFGSVLALVDCEV